MFIYVQVFLWYSLFSMVKTTSYQSVKLRAYVLSHIKDSSHVLLYLRKTELDTTIHVFAC